jgi:hypothetical protein
MCNAGSNWTQAQSWEGLRGQDPFLSNVQSPFWKHACMTFACDHWCDAGDSHWEICRGFNGLRGRVDTGMHGHDILF